MPGIDSAMEVDAGKEVVSVRTVQREAPATSYGARQSSEYRMLNTVMVRGAHKRSEIGFMGIAAADVGVWSKSENVQTQLSVPFVSAMREAMLRRAVAVSEAPCATAKTPLHLTTIASLVQNMDSKLARLLVLQRATRAQLVGCYKGLKEDADAVAATVEMAERGPFPDPSLPPDVKAGMAGATKAPCTVMDPEGMHLLQTSLLPGLVPVAKAFRMKRQPKRDVRPYEKMQADEARAQRYGRKKKGTELHRCIAAHREEFIRYHKNKRTELKRLSTLIKERQEMIDHKKAREVSKIEAKRMQALRENDMEAYTQLVSETKNERLKYLLHETDSYIETIGKLIGKQQDSAAAARGQPMPSSSSSNGGDVELGRASGKSKTYYKKSHKVAERVSQPSLLKGGDLKEYQLAGLQWMVSLYNNNLNGILADEMGLGKTIQTIALITYVMEFKHNKGPFLVVVPLSTLSNWVNEVVRWAPDIIKVVYKGAPETRKNLFKDEVEGGDFNVLLTTYEYVMKDKSSLKKVHWQYIIVDEGHRMKNSNSKFAQILGTVYQSRHRILLTGTPLQNNLPELWSLLNFLLPTIFSSMDTFDQWFNKPFAAFRNSQGVVVDRPKMGDGDDENTDQAEASLSTEERLLIVHRLHEVLRPFMLRRVKDQVLDQLPEKTEMVLKCRMSRWQKDLYKAIADKGLAHKEGRGDKENGLTGLNNIVMQLRKVCNHPYLFIKEWFVDEDLVRAAGKFELLDRILPKLYKAGHRVLMFSQMTQLMTILERYFEHRNFAHLRLDGGTSSEEREKRMHMFNDPDSPYFVFLLSTRAGGLGLNLATADTVILFDSDWNPMMDAQAQDRAHRIGQKNEVRVFRLVTASPIEEKILSRATDKRTLNGLVVEAGEFNKESSSSKGGDGGSSQSDQKEMMESLLKDWEEGGDDDEAEEEGNYADSALKVTKSLDATDIPTDDMINTMMATSDSELGLYQQMDKDRKAMRQQWWEDDHSQKGVSRAQTPKLPGPLMLPTEVPKWINGSSWHGRQAMIFYPVAGTEGALEFQDTRDDEIDADIEAGRSRKRKDVQYDDNMTEQQFMRMMQKQADTAKDTEEEEKKERKEGIKKRKLEAAERQAVEKAAAAEAAQQAAADAFFEPLEYTLQRAMTKILSDVQKMRRADGGMIAELFRVKPSKLHYPDYYALIPEPIGLIDVEKKLKSGGYPDLEAVDADMERLCENARTYNAPESSVFEDSEMIKHEWRRRLAQVRQGEDPSLTKKHMGRPPKTTNRGRPKANTKDAVAAAVAATGAQIGVDASLQMAALCAAPINVKLPPKRKR